MTDHKFTDEEIVKALECCRDFGDCSLCPYEGATFDDDPDCAEKLHTDALALINRQKNALEREIYNGLKADEEIEYLKAEIERLKEEGNKYPCRVRMNENSIVRTKSLEDYDRLIGDISAEAIKEFAERLKKRARMPLGTLYGEMVYLKDIDSLVKEMTEEQKNESQST